MLGLCERFKCLPSALLAEDASLIRLIAVAQLGASAEGEAGGA